MKDSPKATSKSSDPVYPSSSIKRKRRTKAELDQLLGTTQAILQESGAITIRHLFYRLVSLKVIEKTENAYQSLGGHLAKWRRSGLINWDAFVDNTRWHHGGTTYNDVKDALEETVSCYRKNLWASQRHYVEIWTEKDAIASILSETADTFGVKVFVARGFSSLTSLYNAAMTFRRMQSNGKTVHVYYFGDHDPSGIAIDRAVQDTLANDFRLRISFIRAAITPEDIGRYDLPTRPAKTTDRRAKGWEGGCVEIDAMAPDVLQRLVEFCITRHIDQREWEILQQTEAMERETLNKILEAV